jgi:hypothetical protein
VEIVTPQSLSKHIGPHILKELENVYQSWHWACEAHFIITQKIEQLHDSLSKL